MTHPGTRSSYSEPLSTVQPVALSAAASGIPIKQPLSLTARD
jgi:hypothetical protein